MNAPRQRQPLRLLRTALLLACLTLALSSCAANRASIQGSSLRGMVLSDVDRRPFVLGDGIGQIRLVHFFATWCFPCLIETPVLNQLAQEFSRCGLAVVGIGMDLEGAAVLAPFVEMHALEFPVLVPNASVREGRSPFGRIRQLPTTFLFGRDGKPIEIWEGPAEPAKLRALLKKHLGDCRDANVRPPDDSRR